MVDMWHNWAEYFLAAFVVIGLVIALAAPSAVISYVIIFICGLFAGKIIHLRKITVQFPFLMIILGFLVGYLIGVYYGNRKVVLVLFILGSVISYKLYDRGILRHY